MKHIPQSPYPTATYKWAFVTPNANMVWTVPASWFKTRKTALAVARSTIPHGAFAIARIEERSK